jgi:hypothetical protein
MRQALPYRYATAPRPSGLRDLDRPTVRGARRHGPVPRLQPPVEPSPRPGVSALAVRPTRSPWRQPSWHDRRRPGASLPAGREQPRRCFQTSNQGARPRERARRPASRPSSLASRGNVQRGLTRLRGQASRWCISSWCDVASFRRALQQYPRRPEQRAVLPDVVLQPPPSAATAAGPIQLPPDQVGRRGRLTDVRCVASLRGNAVEMAVPRPKRCPRPQERFVSPSVLVAGRVRSRTSADGAA